MWPHFDPLNGKSKHGPGKHATYFRGVQRFPPNTKGFFYFDRPNPLPHPAAGHLRFRVVPEANPALFTSGHDLFDVQKGSVWEKHLIHMKSNATDRHLYDAILQEGLITPDEDRQITEMLAKGTPSSTRGSRFPVLNSILDPFHVDFSVTSFRLSVVDPDIIYEINNAHRWAHNVKGPITSPYSGLCFTRSMADPASTH